MAKKSIISVVFVLILLGFFSHSVRAYDNYSTEFEQLSLYHYNGTYSEEELLSSNGYLFFQNIKLLDKENHIYYVENPRNTLSNNIVITGALESDTAKIISVTDALNSFESNGLPEMIIDYSKGYYYSEENNKVATIPHGNKFVTSPGSLINETLANVIFITVKDGEKTDVHKILIDSKQGGNKFFRDSEFTLFDGTGGQSTPLAQRFQFIMSNQVSLISGIVPEVSESSSGTLNIQSAEIGNKDDFSFPENVDSIRICKSSKEIIDSDGDAFSPNMQSSYTQGTSAERKKRERSYFYYKQKTYSVKINQEKWMEVDDGYISPELKLQQGWNIIMIAGMSVDWINNPNRIRNYQATNYKSDLTRILLVYKYSSTDYSIQPCISNYISSLEVYKAEDSILDSEKAYQRYRVYTKDNIDNQKEKWVDLYSSSPTIWMKIITEDQRTVASVDGSEISHGGFFMKLNPETQNEIIIHLSSDGNNITTDTLHINWIKSDTKLQKLYPDKGGEFTEVYDKDTTFYYLKKDKSNTITICFQGSPNTETDVYIDRKKEESIVDDKLHVVSVSSSVHNIQFKILAENGDVGIYTIAIERTDLGISETTKNRAKTMLDKIVSGGYIQQLQKETPNDSYWAVFRAASFGEEYLNGILAGDVRDFNYTQATSYADTILQLIITGENPYDFLGIDYVEQLAELGPGYYGPYANNIWALLALDAAGYPVDDHLVDIVANQAIDSTFDLDMRGWALIALSNHIDKEGIKEKVDRAIENIKETQLTLPTKMNEYEVTGAFENFWYTNRNINSHACVVSGLTALGVDVGSEEWQLDGLQGVVDGISLFEAYQQSDGKFIRTPNESGANYNKDAVIAVGDMYNGSNVWQRYALSNKRYNALLEEAESLLSGQIDDIELKRQLQDAYTEAEQYRSGSDSNEINEHGTEYFTLQEAVFAVNGKKPDVFQGNAEERHQVRETTGKIDAIPALASLTYADRSIILSAEEAFEALDGDGRLEHYVTNRRTLEKAYSYIHGIDVFLDAMKEIKKVDLSKAAKVKAAREAYDLLDDRQKAEDAVASKYADLLAAEEVIEACRTADNVVAVIDTLGQITTLDSRESIEGARASYDALDETQKAYVTNYDHLVKAEKELQRLETLEEAKAQAAEVDRLISRIGTVNHNSGTIIQTAEEAYQALDQDEIQRLVGGYAYLQEARRLYDNLIREEERSYTASQVDYTISRIEDAFIDGALEITAENEATVREAVNAARAQYDAILNSEEPKTVFYVTGYAYLLHTEAMLQVYDWQQSGVEVTVQDFKDKVLLIPVSPGLESEGDVLIASAMYDALSEEGLLDEESEGLYQELSSRLDELEYLQSNYERIQELEEKVLSLGTIGTSSGAEIQEATDIYKSMDPTLQAYVDPSLVDTLEEAADIFDTLGKDKEAIDRVIDLIDSIREADLDSEDKVQEVREAYDALEAKTGVSNYLILVNAEYRILELKKEEEEFPIASTVIERIKGLGRVQLDDEYKVVSAREAYEALTVTQKKCVKNLADLEEAENRIEALKTATVSLSFQNKKIHEGETVKVKANTSAIDAALTWKISDSSIISFDKKTGMLTGLKAGNASLTAILDNGNQAACHVEITKAAQTEKGKGDNLVLNRKKVTLYTKGSGRTVTLTLTYNGKKISGKQVTWKSNKPSIARISLTGKITAKKKGTAKITASYKGKKVTCKVAVKKPTLKLNKKKLTLSLKKNKTFIIKAVVNGKRVSGKTVKWETKNSKVVKVSRAGKITAIKKGKTIIIAKINGKKETINIKVIK